MSETTELLPLAELLYDAFRDRGGLKWMPKFEETSLIRRENWMRVARIAIDNRWSAFSDEEIEYLLCCIDATGDPYQYEIAHELGAELTRRVATKQERET